MPRHARRYCQCCPSMYISICTYRELNTDTTARPVFIVQGLRQHSPEINRIFHAFGGWTCWCDITGIAWCWARTNRIAVLNPLHCLTATQHRCISRQHFGETIFSTDFRSIDCALFVTSTNTIPLAFYFLTSLESEDHHSHQSCLHNGHGTGDGVFCVFFFCETGTWAKYGLNQNIIRCDPWLVCKYKIAIYLTCTNQSKMQHTKNIKRCGEETGSSGDVMKKLVIAPNELIFLTSFFQGPFSIPRIQNRQNRSHQFPP